MFGKIIEKISYNLSDEHFSFKSILLIFFISAIIIGIIYYITKALEAGKRKKNYRSGKVNSNTKTTLGNATNRFENIDNINGVVKNSITKGIANIRNFFSNTSNKNHINYNEGKYYNFNNYSNNCNEDIYYNNSNVIDEIDYIDSIDEIDDIENVDDVNNISDDDKANKSGIGFKFNTNRKNTIYHDEEDDFFNL